MHTPEEIEKRIEEINAYFGFEAVRATGGHPTRPWCQTIEVSGIIIESGGLRVSGEMEFSTDDHHPWNRWVYAGECSAKYPFNLSDGKMLAVLTSANVEVHHVPFSDNGGDWVGTEEDFKTLYIYQP